VRGRKPVRATGNRFPVAGLFAGIGGIELGLRRSGHETRLMCENDPGANAVLSARFPEVDLREDVCQLRSLPKDIELLTAGFPCQDSSIGNPYRGFESLPLRH